MAARQPRPGSAEGANGAAGVDERGDLAFRLRVAMLGSFGISARADQWPAADVAIAAAHIALYRDKLRALIHHGDQYYLTPPPTDANGDWAAIWYAAKDGLSGVLFAFRLAGADVRRVFRLPGLQEATRYKLTFGSGERAARSGGELAAGLEIGLTDFFRSELCLVERA